MYALALDSVHQRDAAGVAAALKRGGEERLNHGRGQLRARAARADGHKITTLEGLQEEAAEFGAFIADQGAEQCGFCNPGFIMNALALFREQPYPTEEQVKEYLAGNLCRCSGYEGQLRGIMSFLAWKKQKEGVQ